MGYRRICFKVYRRMQSIIVPAFKSSPAIYESILDECIRDNCTWLDLGCGHKLLSRWRGEQECKLLERTNRAVGLDRDLDSLKKHRTIHNKVSGDISHLPFVSCCFDIVTANMVLEHVNNPAIQLKEVYRILAPGGVLLFCTPNTLGYSTIVSRLMPDFIKAKAVKFLQDRKEEDVFPTYYKINSAKNISDFAYLAGFENLQIKMITTGAQLVMIPPLAFLELLLIRVLNLSCMRLLRTNIIAKLRKPS